MILIVTGLPATGKTYFAKQAANKIGAVHLNTDKIRKEINKQGQYDKESKQLVYDYLMNYMVQHLQINENVIIDGTFQKKSHRERFSGEARKHTREVYFVEMRAKENTVKERLKSERAYSEADLKVYQQVKSNYEYMYEPHLVLWSDETSVTEMLQKLMKYINEQRANR